MVRNLRSVALALGVALAAGLTLPAAAQDAEAFTAQVDSAQRAIYAESSEDNAATRERCRNFMNRIMDLDTMTRTAAGDTWGKMSTAQRTSFRSAFEARMANECTKAIRTSSGGKTTLVGVKDGGSGDKLVTTQAGEGNGRMVTWRLRGARAVDAISQGRSLVNSARDEYAAVLASTNGSIDKLIESMRK